MATRAHLLRSTGRSQLLVEMRLCQRRTTPGTSRLLCLLLPSLVAAVGASIDIPFAPTLEAGLSSTALASVEDQINQLIQDNTIPGAVVQVARHGSLAYKKKIGLEQQGDEPIFRLFSMTKPIVAVATLSLVEQGLLGLQDPLANYIPELANPSVYTGEVLGMLQSRPVNGHITIEHLLTHTAGFTYGDDYINSPVDRQVIEDGLLNFADETSDTFISKLAAIPLLFDPGQEFHYSLSFDVLGVVIERIAGQSLDVALRRLVLDPLSMPDTGFFVTEDKASRIVTIEMGGAMAGMSAPVAEATTNPGFKSGGGGLMSTASDYLRFAQMLLNGGELGGVRIVSQERITAMITNRLPAELLPFHLASFPDYRGSGFGYGVEVMQAADEAQKSPQGEVTWGGMVSTDWFLWPEQDVVILALTAKYPYTDSLASIVKSAVWTALLPDQHQEAQKEEKKKKEEEVKASPPRALRRGPSASSVRTRKYRTKRASSSSSSSSTPSLRGAAAAPSIRKQQEEKEAGAKGIAQ